MHNQPAPSPPAGAVHIMADHHLHAVRMHTSEDTQITRLKISRGPLAFDRHRITRATPR